MQHMLFEAAHNGDLDLVRGTPRTHAAPRFRSRSILFVFLGCSGCVLNFLPPDSRAVAGMAMLLVEGRGRLGEAVQAARLRGTGPLDGMGALHIAASKGRLEVCRYLVEELRLDVDDTDQEGPSLTRYRTLLISS
jgi:hypothetical protein